MTNTTSNTANNSKSKFEMYNEKYPNHVMEHNPTFAEVWVRQSDRMYIDRAVVLPELPPDHPVRCSMETWNFQLVARIFADGVSSVVYKGFYNKGKDGDAKPDGSIFYSAYGDAPIQGDDSVMKLNLFMFKGFDMLPMKDSTGNFVKDVNGKITMAQVGKITSVAAIHIEDKETTDKMLGYKTCALPMSLFITGLKKIQLLKNKDGKPRTITGEWLQSSKLNLSTYLNNQTEGVKISQQAKLEPAYAEKDTADYEINETNSFASSGADDLPF